MKSRADVIELNGDPWLEPGVLGPLGGDHASGVLVSDVIAQHGNSESVDIVIRWCGLQVRRSFKECLSSFCIFKLLISVRVDFKAGLKAFRGISNVLNLWKISQRILLGFERLVEITKGK